MLYFDTLSKLTEKIAQQIVTLERDKTEINDSRLFESRLKIINLLVMM